MKKLILISALLFSFNGMADEEDFWSHVFYQTLSNFDAEKMKTKYEDVKEIFCSASLEMKVSMDPTLNEKPRDIYASFMFGSFGLAIADKSLGDKWIWIATINNDAEWVDTFDDHLIGHMPHLPKITSLLNEDLIIVDVKHNDEAKQHTQDDLFRTIGRTSHIEINRHTGSFFYEEILDIDMNPNFLINGIRILPEFIQKHTSSKTGYGECKSTDEKKF